MSIFSFVRGDFSSNFVNHTRKQPNRKISTMVPVGSVVESGSLALLTSDGLLWSQAESDFSRLPLEAQK
jgi:hypothetical protein